MTGRRFLPLIFLVLFASALMTFQERGRMLIHPIEPVNVAFYGLSEGIRGLFSWAGDTLGYFTVRKEHLRALEMDIAALRKEKAQTEEMRRENDRLKSLLELKDAVAGRFVASANVVTRGTKRWANTFTLDAGRSKGVEKDMVVVTPGGLAGKVIQVGKDYSQVLLVNDVRFSAAVRLEETRKEAILSGTGSSLCELQFFPHEDQIKKGDVLISSGLDGIFPEGLRVGSVRNVSKEEGLFQNVQVQPFVDTSRVEEVLIITR